MSLYERNDSPFWWVKLPPLPGETKALQRSTGTANRREAKQVEARLVRERWEQAKLGVKPRHTWEEAVMRWLLETKHKKTHRDDKQRLRWLDQHLGGKHLDEIDRTLIDRVRFARESIASARTANCYLTLVRAILRRACHEWGWLDKVPKVRMAPEGEGRVRSLTREEFQRLIAELPEHLADMAVFAVATGLRQGNVKGLEWRQVDLEQGHAWIPGSQHKNGKPHSVPLTEMTLAVLRKQVGKHALQVFTYCGEPVDQVSTAAWRKALKRAGIEDFRWHDLRHTWASWLTQKGVQLNVNKQPRGKTTGNRKLNTAKRLQSFN